MDNVFFNFTWVYKKEKSQELVIPNAMLVLDKRLKAAIEDSRLEYVYSKKRSELVYPATYYQVNKIGRVI